MMNIIYTMQSQMGKTSERKTSLRQNTTQLHQTEGTASHLTHRPVVNMLNVLKGI